MPWDIIFFCTNYFKSCSFRYKMSFSCVSLALGLFQPHAHVVMLEPELVLPSLFVVTNTTV